MLTFLAMYGPDSAFGWVVLLFLASLPIVAVCALILAVFIGVTRAALARIDHRTPQRTGQSPRTLRPRLPVYERVLRIGVADHAITTRPTDTRLDSGPGLAIPPIAASLFRADVG